MIDEKLVEEARHVFGLNLYEARVWIALLGKGTATAGELSDLANVPRSRVYDILESLERKGFIIIKMGKPVSYIALPPDQVIENVKRKIMEEAKYKINRLEEYRTSDFLETLREIYDKGISVVELSEITGVVRGRRNLISHISHLIGKAKKEVIIAGKGKGFLKRLEAMMEAIREASDKGVEVKIITPVTTEAKGIASNLKKIAKLINKDVEGRFVVVDGKDVVMLTSEEEAHPVYEMGIWVKSPYLAESLKKLIK